jgi:hypothetical protein
MEKKGRMKKEVDEVICWLTLQRAGTGGADQDGIGT